MDGIHSVLSRFLHRPESPVKKAAPLPAPSARLSTLLSPPSGVSGKEGLLSPPDWRASQELGHKIREWPEFRQLLRRQIWVGALLNYAKHLKSGSLARWPPIAELAHSAKIQPQLHKAETLVQTPLIESSTGVAWRVWPIPVVNHGLIEQLFLFVPQTKLGKGKRSGQPTGRLVIEFTLYSVGPVQLDLRIRSRCMRLEFRSLKTLPLSQRLALRDFVRELLPRHYCSGEAVFRTVKQFPVSLVGNSHLALRT